jgi:hypothetical protein
MAVFRSSRHFLAPAIAASIEFTFFFLPIRCMKLIWFCIFPWMMEAQGYGLRPHYRGFDTDVSVEIHSFLPEIQSCH